MTSLSPRGAFIGAAALALLSGLSPALLAQGFNNQWLVVVNETATRLGPSATQVSSNNDEVDLAVGDLDKDGWTDLVVARKQPFTTSGKRPNMLLMNEHGKLVDRTSQYASTADVPGDQGLLQPTNNRDIQVGDVDGDGWLDVVTSPVISFSDPKHINHPRVYRNLGVDGSGNWLGLRFENARIPQILVNGNPFGTNACAIAVGDVTGDGKPELYLIDYDNGDPINGDTNDRLLVNDGNGFFTDGSQAVSPDMKTSGFGTAGAIVDLNGDGNNDIIKSMAGPVTVAYNSPTTPGLLNLVQTASSGSNYNMAAGDMNNDGKVDIAVSDDGFDHYRYNTGNDALGRVNWSTTKTYQFLSGSDDGFAGNAHIVDLDGDGWNDTIHNDVDVDIGGCNRRIHIYHNPGGTPGAQITLREERESSGAGWIGAKGLSSNDLVGGYDSAHLDVDNDGDPDLVLGRCAGTFVWMSQENPQTCQTSIVPATKGDGALAVCGAPLWTGLSATMTIANGPANGIALLLGGFSSSQAPAFGGLVLVPFAFAVVLPLDAAGALSLPVPGGGGTAAGVELYAQALLVPPAAGTPSDITNIVEMVFHD